MPPQGMCCRKNLTHAAEVRLYAFIMKSNGRYKMTITDGVKKLSFEVLEYQTPGCKRSTKNNYNYDANWLMIQIVYEQETQILKDNDACVLTHELKRLHNEMNKMLEGTSSCAIIELMEPYVKFALASDGETFVFILQHNMCKDNKKWTTWSLLK